MESCATDLGNGCGTAQPGQLHKLVHAELVLVKQLLVHGLGLLLAEETHNLSPHPSGVPSRRRRRPGPAPGRGGPSNQVPLPRARPESTCPSNLRYFTAELAMTSESPRPPEISRCGPHQVAPARQAPAWTLRSDRREPATSSPSPRSARSPDIQFSERAPPPRARLPPTPAPTPAPAPAHARPLAPPPRGRGRAHR